MVANVWKVNVAVGQPVNEGDTIVILESMKTEIPIEAPIAGVVKELNVTEGGTVGEGDVIVVLG
jgi:acetyl-CoA carboxylase biotin carboxyl carrier protein